MPPQARLRVPLKCPIVQTLPREGVPANAETKQRPGKIQRVYETENGIPYPDWHCQICCWRMYKPTSLPLLVVGLEDEYGVDGILEFS